MTYCCKGCDICFTSEPAFEEHVKIYHHGVTPEKRHGPDDPNAPPKTEQRKSGPRGRREAETQIETE